MLRLEPRSATSVWWTYASPLLALLLTVVLGLMLFALLDKDPMMGLRMFFWEPIKSARAWSELMLKATPLLIIALGLALCFRSNVWNIGAEGQFVLGAIAATWVGLFAPFALGAMTVPAILLAGMVGGFVWAAITALLRDRFNANEILVSLMLVYVAVQLLNYFVFGPWRDPMGFGMPSTKMLPSDARVPRIVDGYRAHMGLIIGLILVVMMVLFFFRTRAGYAQQVGGLAPAAARYAGFSSRKALWIALGVSGALSGLAGALEVAGPVGQLTENIPVGYGFAAIIVAFVGRLHPVGIVFSAVLMSMFYLGGELAQSRMGLPKSLTGVFQGLLLFCLLACDTLTQYRLVWQRQKA